MMNDKKRIDGGTLLTDKQSQVLYSKIDQLEEEQQKIIDRKDREIERRDEEIKQHSADMLKAEEDKKSAVDELTTLKQEALTKKNRDALHALADDSDKKDDFDQEEALSNQEVDILIAVADEINGMPSNFIFDHLGLHRIKFDHLIEKLLAEGYISEEASSLTLELKYSITSKGRAYLLDNDVI